MTHAESVKGFYDQLAGNYHLIFEDWDASIRRQAAALGAILERECGPPANVRILDCACGIGTQALGLAKLGFQVTACDLSVVAVERTHKEAETRGLSCAGFRGGYAGSNRNPGWRSRRGYLHGQCSSAS